VSIVTVEYPPLAKTKNTRAGLTVTLGPAGTTVDVTDTSPEKFTLIIVRLAEPDLPLMMAIF
jgi:hypothetical protein